MNIDHDEESVVIKGPEDLVQWMVVVSKRGQVFVQNTKEVTVQGCQGVRVQGSTQVELQICLGLGYKPVALTDVRWKRTANLVLVMLGGLLITLILGSVFGVV